MGNCQSGWYRGHAPRCERRVVLDLVNEVAIDWGLWCHKSWRWQGQIRDAQLCVDPASAQTLAGAGVTISYYGHDNVGRCTTVKAVERAAIQDLQVGFGGVRRWICCPGCQRRCRILYGGDRLRCRLCLGLRYRSQLMQPHERADYQMQKISRRLSGKGEQDNDLLIKPKWMRWHTYERLGEQYESLEAVWLTSRICAEQAAEARSEYAAWRLQRQR